MSTIFAKIISGEIETDFVYEDDFCVVIRDLYPKAPVHLLMIPKKPVVNLESARATRSTLPRAQEDYALTIDSTTGAQTAAAQPLAQNLY